MATRRVHWLSDRLSHVVQIRPTSWQGRYGSALLVTIAATLLRTWLDPVLGDSGFAIYVGAVVVAGWLGGIGPCLLAEVLGLVVASLYFPGPPGPQSVVRVLVGLSAYFFVGLAAAVLSEALQAAQQRAKSQANEAIHQREQLQTTLACIAEAVLVTDAQGRLTMMNAVAVVLTGWTAAEALGRPLQEVCRITDSESGEPAVDVVARVLREGPSVSQDRSLVLTARNGRPCAIAYSAAAIPDVRRGAAGVVLILRDETERRQAEQALLDADRRKDEFLATLAHELRNPLAPIGNGLHLLRLADADAGLRAEARDLMQRQFEHLVRLVDDLLDVSRIARGKIALRIEATTLGSVVQRAVEAARPLLDAQQHTLEVELPREPVPLEVDPVRMAQVLTNLLTNAAKYTEVGGRITLSAYVGAEHVAVKVRDTGIGIPPEMLPRVFDLFAQGHRNWTSRHAGLGIGLSIVKSLVQMHGGEVEARSAGSGQGSEFEIRVPVRRSVAASAVQGPPVEPKPPTQRRILVVDDNVDAADSLALLLRVRCHEVCVAHSGHEALRELDHSKPDVVVLDIGMPEMDGCEVARRIRSRPDGKDFLLVALTGWGSPEDRRRTSEAGFDHHFVKPLDPNEIDAALAHAQGS